MGSSKFTLRRLDNVSLRVAFTAIVVIALLLRLVPLLRSGTDWAMWYDSAGYVQLANGLRSGCGFARGDEHQCAPPEIIRTPGYPTFLALLPGLRTAIALQGLIGALSCFLLAAFLLPHWNRAAAMLAGVLLAVDLPSVHASSQILTDSLFESLVIAVVICELTIVRRKGDGPAATWIAVLAGLLLGCAVLVRPNGLSLIALSPLPFVFIGCGWRRRLLLASIAVGIPLLVVVGWTARNKAKSGIATFSFIAPVDAYYYKAGGLLAHQEGISLIAEQKRLAHDIGAAGPMAAQNLAFHRELVKRSREIILSHPITFAVITAENFVLLLTMPERRPLSYSTEPGSDVGPQRMRHIFGQFFSAPIATIEDVIRAEFDSSIIYFVLALLQLAITLFILAGVALAVRGVFAHRGPEMLEVLFPLAVALAFLVSASGPEADARLRLPAVPILVMLAAIGWLGDRRDRVGDSLGKQL
jgi:4-amino-4-deoxy-L-arabinose transferase-like glycosyltransferase